MSDTSFDAHAAMLDEVQHQAGVERARARSHHQPVEAGEAHRRRHALQLAHRAQAGAGAQMRHDDAAARPVRQLRQHAGDIGVGQPMEAVAHIAFVDQRARQRRQLRQTRLRAVERRIETADLRQVRHQPRQGPHAGEIVRLMAGRHRRQAVEELQHVRRQPRRRGKAPAAVHDAMAGGDRNHLRQVALQHVERPAERFLVIARARRAGGDERLRQFARDRQPRRARAAQPFEIRPAHQPEVAPVVEREFQRRRSGVEDERGLAPPAHARTALAR
jgi:hypothetical protein